MANCNLSCLILLVCLSVNLNYLKTDQMYHLCKHSAFCKIFFTLVDKKEYVSLEILTM